MSSFRRLSLLVVSSLIGSGLALSPSPAAAEAPREPAETYRRNDQASAVTAARALGKPVEVLDATTETVRRWANPDGTFTDDLAAAPVRAKKSGRWVDVDSRLAFRGDAVRPHATLGDVAMSAGGAGPLASVVDGSTEVVLGWKGAPLPAPTLDGSTAHYADAMPGIDVEVAATHAGFEQSFVLKNAAAAATPLELPIRTPGLRAKADGRDIALVDAAGKARAWIGAATMWDANDRAASVGVEVRDTPDGPVLEMTPDKDFLADPEIEYPVTVDPLVTLYRYRDAFINSGAPTTNYGSNFYLKAGLRGTSTYVSYITFLVDSYAGKRIVSAVTKLGVTDSVSCSTSYKSVLYRVTSSWAQSTVTWNTHPTTDLTSGGQLADSDVAGSGPAGSTCEPNAWAEFEDERLDDAFQDWADGATNYGMSIRVSPSSSTSAAKDYASGENTSWTPRVSLTWDYWPPAAPTNLSATPHDGYVDVAWTAAANNGSALTSNVLTVKKTDGTVVATYTLSGGTTSKQVTGLVNGTGYTFSVYATNAGGNGATATTGTVVPYGPPLPPASVVATRGDGGFTASWTPGGNNGSPIFQYRLHLYNADGTGILSAIVDGTSEWVGGTNGNGYYVVVEAENMAGPGAGTQSNTVAPAGVPLAPTNVAATSKYQSASVSWSAANGNGSAVTSYTVTASPGGRTATSSGTTALVTGLTNGTSYTFTVKASNDVGQGSASTASPAIVVGSDAVPAAPTFRDATPLSPNAVSVRWYAPTADDSISPVLDYRVTANPGGITATSSGTATNVTMSGLTPATTYTFTVEARNSAGYGPPSTVSPPTTMPPGIPEPVRNLAATPTPLGATLTWDPPVSDNGSPITGYTVLIRLATEQAFTIQGPTVTGTTATIDGLDYDKAYVFVVTANNAVGSRGSAETPAITPLDGPPPAPTQVVATGGSRKATVTFSKQTNTGSPILDFTVTASPGGQSVVVGASATSATVTGLAPATQYTFTVKARNAAGYGPASAPSNAVTTNNEAPEPPTGVTATPRHQAASVSWVAAAANGSAVTSYTVTSSPGGKTATVSAPETSAIVTGLTNGTAYTFTVRATNAIGTSAASAPSAAVMPADATPSAPTNVAATAGDHEATVTWSPPENDGKSTIIDYRVTASPGGQSVVVTGSGTMSATVPGLTAGQTYTFVVIARNSAGQGATSLPSNAVTMADGPGAPTAVTATVVNTTTAHVSWTPPGSSGTTGFRVSVAPGGGCFETTGATEKDVTGLLQGVTYRFTVVALTSGSQACVPNAFDGPRSAPSGPVTMPVVDKASINAFEVVPLDGAIEARWEPAGRATQYMITVNPGGITRTLSGSAVRAIVGGLSNGVAYTVTVTTTNAAGSLLSSPRTVTTAPQMLSTMDSPLRTWRPRAPDLSDDGRYVVWTEGSTGTATENYLDDLLLGDRAEQVTYLPTGPASTPGNPRGYQAEVSGDGRYIAFSALISQTTDDYNGYEDAYVLDRATDVVRLVSADVNGNAGNGRSTVLEMTPDGRYVLIRSEASNLVPDDVNGGYDLFVKDMTTGAIDLVSKRPDENDVDGPMWGVEDLAYMSGDARYVAGGDSRSGFWRDRVTGRFVKIKAGGAYAGKVNALSRDGMTATFSYPDPETGLMILQQFFTDPADDENLTLVHPGLSGASDDLGVSPDGSVVLAYQYQIADLLVLNRTTGTVSRVVDGGSDEHANAGGAIAANNQTIAFSFTRSWPYDAEIRTIEYRPYATTTGQVWTSGWRQRVNTGTGDYVESTADARVRAVGPALENVRTYNSGSATTGWFGTSISSTYETRLDAYGDSVVVVHPDGRVEYFTKNGVSNGAFIAPAGSASRLAKNADGSYTLTQGDASTATFSSTGRLTKLTDRHGFDQTLTYGSDGKLSTVTDVTSGRALHYGWTGARVTSVQTDTVGIHGGPLTWTYGYTGDLLTSVCAPPAANGDTRCTTYEYLGGKLIAKYNPYGERTLYLTFHADGRVQQSAADGATPTSFEYPFPGVTEITEPLPGQVSRHEYDTSGRLVREVDPYGATKTVTYDANGWPRTVTDENNTVTTTIYSATGDKTSDAAGANATLGTTAKTAYLGYDAAHNVTTVRDRRSTSVADNRYLTTRLFDSRNNMYSETGPAVDGTTHTRTWAFTTGSETAIDGGSTPAGLVKSATDARGRTTSFRYAANGDLRETENPAGLVVKYTHDELGRITTAVSVSDGFPSGTQTTYTYDELSRVVIETRPLTHDAVTDEAHQLRVTTTYDRAGRVTRVAHSDAAGDDLTRTVDYGVDRAGRITSTTDNETGVTATYQYDAAGNLYAHTDRLSRRTEVTYNLRNQREVVTQKAVDLQDGSPAADVVLGTFSYDDAGRLTLASDVLGRDTEYTYDTLNRVEKETLLGFDDPAGPRDLVVQRVRYDAIGNVEESWRGSALLHEQFTVDAMNRVRTHVLDPGGLAEATTLATYDAEGHELTHAADDSGTITNTYDDLGLLSKQVVDNGATDLTSWFGHDDRGLLASVTDARGATAGDAANTTTTTYDEAGRPTVTKLPAVETFTTGGGTATVRPTTTTGYNTFGEAEHVRDARGAVTTTTYDRLGRRVRVDHPSYTPPSGGAALTPYETWTWDDANRLRQHRDRGAGLTDYEYDELDHLVKRQDPAVAAGRPTWLYDVDLAGRVLSMTDPVGAVVEQTYDQLDNVRTRTEVVRQDSGPALRATTTYSYDDLGHLTKRVDPAAPLAAEWLYEHDVTGNVRKIVDPTSEETVSAYDAAGRLTSTTDALGQRTESVYDLAGRQTETNAYAPDGTRVGHATAQYDAVGNLTQQTSQRGFETWLEYDATNALQSVQQWLTAPSATGEHRTTGYDYDAAGLLTRSADGRAFSSTGLTPAKTTSAYDVTYTYNVWGLRETMAEPATTAHPAAADRTWTTSYDDRGLPVSEVRPGGVTVTRTFDALGRLTAENGAAATGVPAAARTFGYDLAGNVTSAGYPSGGLTFGYDDRGDLVDATHPNGSTSIVRDALGRPLTVDDPAGTHTFTWTRRGELDTETDPLTGVTVDHDYDEAGRLSLDKFGTNAGVRRYGYDDAGRLETDRIENAAGQVQASTTYGYDADGNVESQDVTAAGNAGAGLSTYTYDAIGRLDTWTKPDRTTVVGYDWDGADNRVTAGSATYTYDERSRLTSGGGSTYTWSPRGTLATRTTGGGTTSFTFDALDRMVGAGATTYAYDSLDRIAATGFAYTGLSAEPTKTPGTTLSRGADGSVTAMRVGTTSSLVALNQHGDVAATFDAAGTVGASRTYDPFGAVSGSGGGTGDVAFQADFKDSATGLTWMSARWYDETTGSFTSRDTMAKHTGAPTLLNRYGYGDANPVTFSDPDGHCAMTSTGWGGCSPDNGPGSYAVTYAVAGYTDSQVIFDNELNYILSQLFPPSPTAEEDPEAADVLLFEQYHQRAAILLGGASAALSGMLEPVLSTYSRFTTVLGHLEWGWQPVKDLLNVPSAALNGLMRAAEETVSFGSWVVHKATFGAVPKWDATGVLPRVGYVFDDARSREFSSLAEDIFTIAPPVGIGLKLASKAMRVARLGKSAIGARLLRMAERRASTAAAHEATQLADQADELVTVYRVEAAGINERVFIGADGSVSIPNTKDALHLNFGVKSRAEEYLARKRARAPQVDWQTKAFEVPRSVLDKIRGASVKQGAGRRFPGLPQRVDESRAVDQFGLPTHFIDYALENIVPGSGRVIT